MTDVNRTLHCLNQAADNYFHLWKNSDKTDVFIFSLLMSAVCFTLGAKTEIKIQQELLMRLKKACIFLKNNGLPVTLVTFYCVSLKVNAKGNTSWKKKIELYKRAFIDEFRT